MTAALRTDRLTKYYGRVVGLDGLSLEVPEGEIFGFLGLNGAGKTTTIRLLLDLVRPTSGDAWILGRHCRRDGVSARRLVGYLPGELPIYPELTGRAYLRFLARVGRQTIDDRWLAHLFQRFDVSDLDLGRPMRDYSQGMKRKLGIIQALAANPPMLILDEPTNGLDPLMIEAFAETLDELKKSRRTTVFLSSHVLSEVEKTCDRIGLVRRGQLAALQSVPEIRRHLPRRVTVTFTAPVNGAVPHASAILLSRSERAWVLDVRGPMGGLVTSLNGLPVDDVRVEPATLEDYVLRFYSEGGEA
jgi:ABC-2 type transport system ATP-binding protein